MDGYRHEYSDILADKAVAEGKITSDDSDLIKLYFKREDFGGTASSTRYNTFYTLVSFRQYIGEYRKNSIEDLFRGVTKYKESDRNSATLILQLGILRRFYVWLINQGFSSIQLEMVSHKIRVRRPDGISDPLISVEDVILLINACKSSRDRAFISLLYDTGIRTKDACALTWDDLAFDREGSGLLVKEGKISRNIRCTIATGYLIAWKNDYPGDTSAKNFVFLTEKGDPFTNRWALRLLGKIVRESGILTPVHLHSIKRDKVHHHKTELMVATKIKKMLWEIR